MFQGEGAYPPYSYGPYEAVRGPPLQPPTHPHPQPPSSVHVQHPQTHRSAPPTQPQPPLQPHMQPLPPTHPEPPHQPRYYHHQPPSAPSYSFHVPPPHQIRPPVVPTPPKAWDPYYPAERPEIPNYYAPVEGRPYEGSHQQKPSSYEVDYRQPIARDSHWQPPREMPIEPPKEVPRLFYQHQAEYAAPTDSRISQPPRDPYPPRESRKEPPNKDVVDEKELMRPGRPWECPRCMKVLNTPGELLLHIETHATVKPYMCLTCQKTFTLKHHVTRHIRKSHTNCTMAMNVLSATTRKQVAEPSVEEKSTTSSPRK
eukprot:Colp12_sorted_trinity150504_noHs@9113